MLASSAGSVFPDDFAGHLIAAISPRQSAAAPLQRSFRIPDMFAGIFTLGPTGFIINLAFLKIERHVLRWRGTSVAT